MSEALFLQSLPFLLREGYATHYYVSVRNEPGVGSFQP